MNKVDAIKVLAEDKTFENEAKHKGDNDLDIKIKILAKQFKLDKVLEYVEKPNDADKKIKKLEKRLKKLEKDAIKWRP